MEDKTEMICGAVYRRENGNLGVEYGVMLAVSESGSSKKGLIHSLFHGVEGLRSGSGMNGWVIHSLPTQIPVKQPEPELAVAGPQKAQAKQGKK